MSRRCAAFKPFVVGGAGTNPVTMYVFGQYVWSAILPIWSDNPTNSVCAKGQGYWRSKESTSALIRARALSCQPLWNHHLASVQGPDAISTFCNRLRSSFRPLKHPHYDEEGFGLELLDTKSIMKGVMNWHFYYLHQRRRLCDSRHLFICLSGC